MKSFDGKVFMVYGDGVSGRSAAAAIVRHGGQADVIKGDGDIFVAPPEKDYTAAIISPGIKPTHGIYTYCKAQGLPTAGEVDIGYMLSDAKKVGVTGTNGKTTVTRLIAAMTGGIACGNIGYPVSTAAEEKGKTLVCELSSFQLYGASVRSDVAVITNIGQDHLDWHGSAEEYYRCKCKIADGAEVLILGEDIPIKALSTLKTNARIVRCVDGVPVDGAYTYGGWFYYFGERICEVDYLRLLGSHNVKNALCAIAAAKTLGADNGDIIAALSSAKPDPHRLDDLGKLSGKRYIDDSKSTNILSALAAVEATSGSICLILGGSDKNLDFDELFINLDKRVVSVVAMGLTAAKVEASAKKFGIKATVVPDLKAAVETASREEGDTVLLSPACASFDEFNNYGERGEAFKRLVRELSDKS